MISTWYKTKYWENWMDELSIFLINHCLPLLPAKLYCLLCEISYRELWFSNYELDFISHSCLKGHKWGILCLIFPVFGRSIGLSTAITPPPLPPSSPARAPLPVARCRDSSSGVGWCQKTGESVEYNRHCTAGCNNSNPNVWRLVLTRGQLPSSPYHGNESTHCASPLQIVTEGVWNVEPRQFIYYYAKNPN